MTESKCLMMIQDDGQTPQCDLIQYILYTQMGYIYAVLPSCHWQEVIAHTVTEKLKRESERVGSS